MTKKLVVKPLRKDTYLTVIQNACGSKMWANNYALVNGKKEDILQNGSTSCAFFVSSILKMFDLIKDLHVTVNGTEKDLKQSGWRRIAVTSKMPPGSILIWEKKKALEAKNKNTATHAHIGFYIGKEQAVSIWIFHNFPIIHHWTYSGKRKVLRAYWNPKI
ncbi:MAG: hypothetical protein GYA31_02755 [Parcubacteria group bacterium]|nr:hypothetical protein [Parcubacteria group bacterium]